MWKLKVFESWFGIELEFHVFNRKWLEGIISCVQTVLACYFCDRASVEEFAVILFFSYITSILCASWNHWFACCLTNIVNLCKLVWLSFDLSCRREYFFWLCIITNMTTSQMAACIFCFKCLFCICMHTSWNRCCFSCATFFVCDVFFIWSISTWLLLLSAL